MTHDPFDQLRDANPVPGDSLPSAPMDTAERIMRRRAVGAPGWPGWVVATAATVAVLLVGGGWMLWLGRGDGDITAAGPTTSPTGATGVSTAIDTTAYLLTERADQRLLVPVPRTVLADGEVEAALTALLGGPTNDEAAGGISSALPEGVAGPPIQVSGVTPPVATVRIPSAYLSMVSTSPEALAQIVFTITRVDGIDAVVFELGDGAGVPGGIVVGSMQLVPESEFENHAVIEEDATRSTFETLMPPAFIEQPQHGADISLPYPIFGVANSIGHQVRLSLVDAEGAGLWEQTVIGECGTPWNDDCGGEWGWSKWVAEIPDIGYVGPATLTAESFGSGVEIIDRRSYPLTISDRAPSTVTTIPPTTVPAIPGPVSELAVYMLMEPDATHSTPGPHLIPAAWTTAVLSAPLTDAPRQAMEWLLQGPLPGWADATPALFSEIPSGTRLLGLEVAGGLATVDLSSEFTSVGASPLRGRLGQVVFTLTRFEHIDRVLFVIEGAQPMVLLIEGVTDDGADRTHFDDLLPPIMIETPLYLGLDSGSPLVVSGTADVFEAAVSLALTDNEGSILWEGFTTATCGTGCRGDWSVEIPHTVPEDQLGAVIAWEVSARDGSQTNVREHPVWLAAAEPVTATCSGGDVPDDLPDLPGLPEAAAVTRQAIFQAARACEFDALTELLRRGPSGSTADATIRRWRIEEAAGQQTMYWLAETLRLPGALDQVEQIDGRWLWPGAAAYYWSEVPDADLQALLGIYTEADLESFTEFDGFYMHRIAISPDGLWLYYAVGD